MNHANALLGLLTETSLHAGAGSSAGAVDLPIQREGHSGWPCVFGSSLKGALRDRGSALDADDLHAVFGPDTRNASDNAGALSAGDARLLLLPVRSLTSSFKWVTCAEALNRFKRLAAMLGVALPAFDAPSCEAMNALTCTETGNLFLEEYRFTQKTDPRVDAAAEALATLMARDNALVELQRRLVVVSDDLFAHLAAAALPVNAHIALEAKTKTVAQGALWYEETLPPETLLYAPLMAAASRKKGHALTAQQVRDKLRSLFEPHAWLQLGGNETVGMGWCAVKLVNGRE